MIRRVRIDKGNKRHELKTRDKTATPSKGEKSLVGTNFTFSFSSW